MKTRYPSALRGVECLESRIAPATLVNPTTVTYQDVDGDHVIVKLSKPLFDAATINSVLDFNPGSVNGSNASKQQLRTVDLNILPAAGASLTLTATRSSLNGGNGFANVGHINASLLDLAIVSVDGDLGKIVAGDFTTSTPGLNTLTVQSLGRFDISTQPPGGDLKSSIQGALGKFTVKSDVIGVDFQVVGGSDGKIGTLAIGGSLIGGSAAESGRLHATSTIGAVTIKGDIHGGGGDFSGQLLGDTGITRVEVFGNIIGGGGTNSGSILATSLDEVIVRGDVIGGSNDHTGMISTNLGGGGPIGSITIRGSLIGGDNGVSGLITAGGDVERIQIVGDLRGSAFQQTGIINTTVGVSIGNVSIGGSLIGGSDIQSGAIFASAALGKVTIGHDFIQGNEATITAATIAGVRVKGSMLGGLIESTSGGIGPVSIGGVLAGGFGPKSGSIVSAGTLGDVTIGGGMVAGAQAANESALIRSQGNMGKVRIGGDIRGGQSLDSGKVQSVAGAIAKVQVGGSVVAGSIGNSGQIIAFGNLGPVKIGRQVIGGGGTDTGQIRSETGAISSVHIAGALVGGAGANSGRIDSVGDVVSIRIGGDVVGGGGNASGTIRSAGGIGVVSLGGSLVGQGPNSGRIFASASLGKVSIARDIQGGGSGFAGEIFSFGPIGSVAVVGSLVGGAFTGTGRIASNESIGPIKIGRNVVGGAGQDAGGIKSSLGSIARVTVGGSVFGGTGFSAGSIRAGDSIGPISIKRNLVGTASDPVVISARGQATPTSGKDLAIVSLTVGGRVEHADILAGYDPNGNGRNADAQIGPVKIGVDWIGSNLVAGVTAGFNGFGGPGDTKISGVGVLDSPETMSKIGPIVIKGLALGNPLVSIIIFGIVAEQVQSLSVHGTAFLLQAGAKNDLFPGLNVAANLNVLEV